MRTIKWDDLPQDMTLQQLSDVAHALGIHLRVRLAPLYRCEFLAEAWKRLANYERGKER